MVEVITFMVEFITFMVDVFTFMVEFITFMLAIIKLWSRHESHKFVYVHLMLVTHPLGYSLSPHQILSKSVNGS